MSCLHIVKGNVDKGGVVKEVGSMHLGYLGSMHLNPEIEKNELPRAGNISHIIWHFAILTITS